MNKGYALAAWRLCAFSGDTHKKDSLDLCIMSVSQVPQCAVANCTQSNKSKYLCRARSVATKRPVRFRVGYLEATLWPGNDL